MSINKQLRLAIFLITAISAFILMCFSFATYYQSSTNNLKADTETSLDKSALLIEERINDIDILTEKAQFFSKSSYDLMSDLKNYTANKNYSVENYYYSEQEIKGIFRTLIYRMEFINFLAIILPNGKIISYSNTQKDFLYDYNPLKANWYKKTLEAKGDLYISTVVDDGITLNGSSEQTIFFSRNIFDLYSNELLGTLVVNSEPQVFNFLSKGFPDKVVGFTLTDKRRDQTLYNHSPSKSFSISDLKTTINAKRQPLTLSVIIDNSEYFKLLFQILTSTFVILLIVLLLAYAVSSKFSKKFTQPIVSLSNSMKEKLDPNDLLVNDHYNNRRDEIGTLYKEYEKMMRLLKNNLHEKLNYEKSLQKSELNVYKNQINSHFLYNTLESINSIAEIEEIEEISEITLSLSNMFRYAANGFVNVATLEDELKNVDDYLTIQRIRFQYQIDFIVINYSESTLKSRVPKVILQPIIENSIFHGLNRGGIPGKIRLFIFTKNNNLIIRIFDNGLGIDPKQLLHIRKNIEDSFTQVREKTAHIGLINIEARIKNIYGEHYGISIFSQLKIGTLVEIVLPNIKTEEDHV